MGSSLISAAEVAELLGVPKSWVYEQSRRGRIPTVTLGRYRRYRREAIEAWVHDLEADGNGAQASWGSSTHAIALTVPERGAERRFRHRMVPVWCSPKGRGPGT